MERQLLKSSAAEIKLYQRVREAVQLSQSSLNKALALQAKSEHVPYIPALKKALIVQQTAGAGSGSLRD